MADPLSKDIRDFMAEYVADGEAWARSGGEVDGIDVDAKIGAATADLASDADLAAHVDAVTSVHGIPDTSALLDVDDIGVTVQAHDADLDTLAGLGIISNPATGRLAIGGIELGGTGVVDVSASLLNGWALGSGGSLVLSRSKNVVMLEGSNLVRAAATNNQFLTIPSGFRPASATASFTVWDTYQISGTTVERGHVLAVGTARIDSSGASAPAKYFTATWATNDPWPTSI